jgi:hypothetical protein
MNFFLNISLTLFLITNKLLIYKNALKSLRKIKEKYP